MADEQRIELITVKSGRKDNKVALWEKNDEQPGGEVLVYGKKVVQVARTPLVNRRLADGELVETNEAPSEPAQPDNVVTGTATTPEPADNPPAEPQADEAKPFVARRHTGGHR